MGGTRHCANHPVVVAPPLAIAARDGEVLGLIAAVTLRLRLLSEHPAERQSSLGLRLNDGLVFENRESGITD